MKSISLIANSGIQFYTTEATFNPSDQAVIHDTPIPSFLFTEYPSLDNTSRNVLEIAYKHGESCYLLSELSSEKCIKKELSLTGDEDDVLDESGQPILDHSKINVNNLSEYGGSDCYSEFNIEGSFSLFDKETGLTSSPFEKILGQWIPVPLFYYDENNKSKCSYPSAWCRVNISLLRKGKIQNVYQFVWAFDTSLSEDENDQMLPYFPSNTHKHIMGVPTRASHLLSFFKDNDWVSTYLSSLIFGVNKLPDYGYNGKVFRCRHLAYYLNLFTQLRVMGICPIVTLYNRDKDEVPVDLVLDIGNSRTCGVLFEEQDFTKAKLLSLRDLSDPSVKYDGSFDMRLAFHRTEFGRDNMELSGVFQWRSFLRIGEEAKKLISKARKSTGESERMTHHSSPKRYLWDDTPYKGQWEYLLTDEEPVSVQRDAVFVTRLSEQFNSNGTFRVKHEDLDQGSSFSRCSLMTCVMIEIIQQATCQINSYDYLNVHTGHGNIDRPRVINNIIITCPTAMSEEEQTTLRRCASDAYIAIQRSRNPNVLFEVYKEEEWKNKISIVPSVQDLKKTDSSTYDQKKEWGYDEATCCQLVYLYSEIASKYNGNCSKFIENKGHINVALKAEGYEKKSITIGSVDIGAGTTDIMICSYKYDQSGEKSILTPIPLFWDSFFIAGDDILHEIVFKHVLREGTMEEYREGYGSIFNAVCANLLKQFSSNIPVDAITKQRIESKAMSLLVSFFGPNSSHQSYLDRIMRNDFNVQVSVPIAQKMLDMMKNSEVACDLNYKEIFENIKPSDYLLDYFEEKFGFRFESLIWNYSPQRLTESIRGKMETLLKQLSIILNTYNCDVVLLAGRPTSLEAVTDMFLKFFPVSPDRLIRLLPRNENAQREDKKWNCYRVGRWFPTADERGYFLDLKPVVAVGAMVGYLASHAKLPLFQLDMSQMKKKMTSTANYMGTYETIRMRISKDNLLLSPEKNTANFKAIGLPYYIGCKQINTEFYQSRPLYALVLKRGIDVLDMYDLSEVRFTVMRMFIVDKEKLQLLNAYDKNNYEITDLVQLKIQSLTSEDGYWLDNGAFDFN